MTDRADESAVDQKPGSASALGTGSPHDESGASAGAGAPDQPAPTDADAAPEAPGVGGDARLHDLGGDTGPSPSSSRGGGGLGPEQVRELTDRD